ncbi:SDR family NAD(P)-dependent oxidoreductase [Microbacterium phyllosphaerae]|uniref:SDR family NAD(P)-dependent oxidoreductase n=1 Tax=Microbacterium phyllosphaerae TaxID=124798 RepID=UPI000EA1F607|nr:SDR family NAD(P)-dependent oxidoreductase [Microbacterium phyllosphaerae]
MRTYLVTGSASGIGQATAELLIGRGDTVITADRADAAIVADLSTDAGRRHLVDEAARLAPEGLDGVIAVAGIPFPVPATIAVNYFGMITTLEGLRPLLLRSAAPRAVGVSSMASLWPFDEDLVTLQLAGDEPAALRRADELAQTEEGGQLIYPSSKVAFSRWLRRSAIVSDWAGSGIPLNAVAPGTVVTGFTRDTLATDEGREMLERMVPMPLAGPAPAAAPAHLLAWLAGAENTHVTGQVVFIDGGNDATLRGDSTW